MIKKTTAWYLKRALLVLIGTLVLAAIALFALVQLSPSRTQLPFDDPYHTDRKLLEAKDYAVVSGTPWATKTAIDVLEDGGNAFDAAVAGVLMLNITFGEAASFPGVAPVMLYDARKDEVRSYIGAGTAPAKATIDLFRERGYDKIPDLHILSQLVPASPDVLITLLQEYGSKPFYELVQPAIDKGLQGFPVHHTMAKNLDLSLIERLGYAIMLPTSAEVYFGKRWWLPLREKDEFKRPHLAKTLTALARAEKDALAAGADRREALEAVREYFYKGPIAKEISQFHQKENGLISYEDLAGYESSWEQPLEGNFGEYTIFVNGTWSQGIVIPMALQILEGVDLKSMGHNTADYVHALVQAIDLTMADREAYVADPKFVEVPIPVLLSKAFAAQRRKGIKQQAFQQMPAPGRIEGFVPAPTSPTGGHNGSDGFNLEGSKLKAGDDTSQIAVIDSAGNAVAITPSDFPMSPMIPNTGLTLGIRMTQFSLDPDHENRLEPGKRPRITPHAAIVFRNGKFFMAFNTPGGDMQTQALIQVFLNMTVFGMDVQTAIDAPRFRSLNFPSSFDPDDYSPGLLTLEKSLYEQVLSKLKDRGYTLQAFPDWDNKFSAVGAIVKDGERIFAGSDPRESGVADGH